MLEGVQAVQARIAHIQNVLAPRRAEPLGQTTTAATPKAGSFASALASATDSTTLTPAVRKSPGSYGPMDVPEELRRYGNGKIPDAALSSIGVGDFRLERKAAEAFTKMRVDAKAAGVTIGVEDAYRTYAEQVDLAKRKGLFKNGGLAAVPGTSNHGWGLALDLDLDTNALKWMRDNGYKYGFAEDTPREPWHWGYRAPR